MTAASDLIRAADLAAELGLEDEAHLHRLRRRKGWPCVKISRFDVRFTPEQVERIIAIQTHEPAKPKTAGPVSGQTKRSARRSA